MLGSEACAGDSDHVCPVSHAIESRGSQERIVGEHVGPLLVVPVAGDHQGAALVAFVDHLVEILLLYASQACEPEVVEDCLASTISLFVLPHQPLLSPVFDTGGHTIAA